MSNTILFLDFDGVIRLRVPGAWSGSDNAAFCQERMARLAAVCETAGAKIVITSDWRNRWSVEQISAHLDPHLSGYLAADWRTPSVWTRATEVEEWLSVHPEVWAFAILDDRSVLFRQARAETKERLVLCANHRGFEAREEQETLRLLGTPRRTNGRLTAPPFHE